MNRFGWLAAHPVGGYVALACAVSYLAGGPVLIAVQSLAPPDAFLVRTYGSRVLVVWGPAIAGLIMASVTGRQGGAAALLRLLIPCRFDLPLAAAILVAGGATAAGALLMQGVRPDELRSVLGGSAALAAAHWLLQLTIIATGEELGWRGWLLPELGARMSRFRATMITAGIWTIWHGPLLLGDPRVVLAFVAGVFGLSVLFAWLRWRASTTLVPVIAAHASVNAPLFFWEQVAARTGPDARLSQAWIAMEMTFACAALVLLTLTWRWWTRGPAASLHPSG